MKLRVNPIEIRFLAFRVGDICVLRVTTKIIGSISSPETGKKHLILVNGIEIRFLNELKIFDF